MPDYSALRNWKKRRERMTHQYQHKVQYYETDQMGVVHHSNYIRWFEEARVDYLEQIGLPYKQMEDAGIGSPVLSVTCQYQHKVCFGETVTILVVLKHYTGLRMTIGYTVLGEDGQVRCVGETGHCFLNEKGRPVSLRKVQPEWDAIFQQFQAAQA